ncbi:MAG: lactonase family protein [Acidobacteriota bacterium]
MAHFHRKGVFLSIFAPLFVWLTVIPSRASEPQQKGAPPEQTMSAKEYLVYIGTYTREASEGIYVWRFSPSSGEITSLGLAAEIREPSFLALHPQGNVLYAVSETDDYDEAGSGSITAFRIHRETGKLSRINQVSSGGGWPCHLQVDQTGRMLAVANYRDGRVASVPLERAGRLGKVSSLAQHEGSSVNPERQEGPHAHSVNFSPDNRYLVAADLGLDKLLIYRVNLAQGSLETEQPGVVKIDAGAGPRHFAFGPSGRFGYLINELQSSVTVFRYQARSGQLEELQTISTLPEDFKGANTTAEIGIHPSGSFLYGSNRGHDSIAIFAIDGVKGTLRRVDNVPTLGKTPRNFAIDPTGATLFAANQDSDTVVLFRIDAQTGRLTAVGRELRVDSPVCVKFVASR